MIKADRKLTIVGLRIVGLCVLAYAIVTFGNNALSAGGNLYVFTHTEVMGPTLNPTAPLSEGKKSELMSEFQTERSMKKNIALIGLQHDVGGIIWAAIVFFLGFYMCRRGEGLLLFLNATEEKDSQPGAGTLR